jgi:hypothetical protein
VPPITRLSSFARYCERCRRAESAARGLGLRYDPQVTSSGSDRTEQARYAARPRISPAPRRSLSIMCCMQSTLTEFVALWGIWCAVTFPASFALGTGVAPRRDRDRPRCFYCDTCSRRSRAAIDIPTSAHHVPIVMPAITRPPVETIDRAPKDGSKSPTVIYSQTRCLPTPRVKRAFVI